LTTSGPYAQTRDPLYLGSAVLAFGAAIATYSIVSAVVLAVYFSVVYAVVMRREEGELRGHHGDAFEQYAKAVPLFFPRITPAKLPGGEEKAFSFAQYKKNHEHEATIGFVLLLALLLVLWRWPLHRFLHF
jgi:Phospholipid methyltransferase